MKSWTRTLTFVLVLVATDVVVAQDEGGGRLRLASGEIKVPEAATTQAGTSGVEGLQMGLLSGGPKQAGLYTMFLKLAPNTKIQPHSHPDNRVGIVVSGTWYFAYGDSFDEGKLKALPAGSFYTEPPGATHFAMTKGEPVTVYITGVGPSATTYVESRGRP
jgi:quercetin dioxygenase-like cupin family protein